MVDIDCSTDARKARVIIPTVVPAPDMRVTPPSSATAAPHRLASPKSTPPSAPNAADVAAYEQYLRLPELSALWADGFPEWRDERVLTPALQGLEVTFRFASLVLSDRRPYADRRLWARRVEGLAAEQVQIIADLVAGDDCDDGHREEREAAAVAAKLEGGFRSRSSSSASLSASTNGNNIARLRGAPVTEIRSATTPSSSPTSSCSNFAAAAVFPMSRARTSEVWKLPGEAPVVTRTSEDSLLPLLATWAPSKPLATRILDEIDAQFKGWRCPFTLGLGEPNLDGKPVLRYDHVCRPAALHALKLAKAAAVDETSQAVFTTHQVLECWAQVARQLLRRIGESLASSSAEDMNSSDVPVSSFSAAASDCWALERVWKLLADVNDLHLLLDTDDFLRLKARLALSGSGLCFRSKALAEAAHESRELRRHVPAVLGVEADPTGGPALQDAAMELFRRRSRNGASETATAKRIHLLQAFQAVDAAVKKFFFAYRQVVVAIMGSLEVETEAGDPLAQMFMEPPYCPSIDAAKTFLADRYCRRQSLHKPGPAPAAAGDKSAHHVLTHL